MFFSTWLRNTKNSLECLLALNRKQKRRSIAHPLARTFLYLETLEARITPSGFQTLYNFTGGNDGKAPDGTLMVDANGNVVGPTSAAGANGQGTIFQFNPSNSALTTLHAFSTNSGYLTYQGVIHDSSGNLYGTTVFGGSANDGTVFELSPDGQTFTILHNFTGNTNTADGASPEAPLIMDGKGNLYGTTAHGGNDNFGTVFELSPNGSGGYNYTTLHSFNGTSDGSFPVESLSMDRSGNLYGIAVQGGADGHGTAFELSPKGSGGYNFTLLHTFAAGNDGAQPYSNLVMDSKGNLYGTTTIDGLNDAGTVYEITPSSNTFATIYSFQAPGGYDPTGNLVIDSKGNLYGITELGGTGGQGTAFELSPNGTGGFNLTTLHNFSGSDGVPALGLTADSLGDLYGTTISGGANNDGTIFELRGAIAGLTATKAGNAAATFSSNPHNVTLTASVNSGSGTVNEGTVTFTVVQGNTVIGQATTSSTVNNGQARVSYTLPAGLPTGTYTIDAEYSGGADFSTSSDTSHTLTIGAAQVATTANDASTVYSSNIQTVNVSAAVTDASAPGDTVTAGTVTFTILNGGTKIGSVQGDVENGTANANFDLPGGTSIGNYTIDVSYDDNGKGFSDGSDTSGTLTIAPANLVTTAADSNITFNPAAQTLALDATVVNNSLTSDSVGEGTVTFTIKTSQFVVGSVSTAVSGGAASADFNWTPGRAVGTYTIAVSYQDSQGTYLDGGDINSTLTVAPALVTTTAANASAVYSPNAQTVVLSAGVSSPGIPVGTLDTDTVTFTIENGTTIVGSVQGAVSGGTANANFTLPAGLAAGSYTLAVSYSDSHGNFSDDGDTGATLTITPANVATTASNAVIILPNSQSVTLNASVADSSVPTDTVNEGTVTFTVMKGTTTIGNAVQGVVSGGTASADFTVPAGLTAGTYTLAVSYSDSNSNFSDNGDTNATLTALLAPTVTASPSDETVPVGGTAVFTAAANGSPTLTVQWQVSTDGGNNFTNISGATSATLTLENVQASQNRNEYQAVFTNSYGTATTSAATLTVPFAPTVTTNPSNQMVTAGQNATFTAAAGGSPAPTVQWQVSTDGGKTFTNISGATGSTLTLSNVQASQDDSEYQAVFTNSLGTAATSAATLNVEYAPAVTSNPSDQTTTAGDEAKFTAAANGNPTPTVQWQVSTDGGKTFSDISGATNLTLTLAGLTTGLSGNLYQAVFTNSIGSTTSSAATLTVHPAVIPVITGNPTGQTASAGAAVSFTASASGDPTPTVQWQVSTDGGNTFSNVSGATSTTLTLTGITPAMNGYKYQAFFSNSAGSAVSIPVTLTINAPPSSSQPMTLNVPPLLALLGQLIRGIETANANGTETVMYSLFGIALVTANYDSFGNFASATLFGISIPNWVWNLQPVL